MAKVEALVQAIDAPGDTTPKRNDIVVIKPAGYPWGAKEGPPVFRIVTLDDEDFYDIKNLTMEWDDNSMEALPASVRAHPRHMTAYLHGRTPQLRAFRRYCINDQNEVEDKANANRRVKRT